MHRKALALNEKLERMEDLAWAYCNLGIVFELRGNLDEATQLYTKAVEIAEEKCSPALASRFKTYLNSSGRGFAGHE